MDTKKTSTKQNKATDKKTPDSSKQNKAKQQSSHARSSNYSTHVSTKSKPAIGVIAAFSLAAVGCVLSILALMQTGEVKSKQNNKITTLSQDLSTMNRQQQSLSTQVDKALSHVEKSQSTFGNNIASLEKTLSSALKQQNYNTSDWLAHKAMYYMQLAQITLYWSNDIKSSIALLQKADELLKEVGNNKLFEARQSLAEEIASLKSTKSVDKPGLLSQLNALSSQLINLPINKQKFEMAKTESVKEEKELSQWQKAWSNSLDSLKRLVVVRYHNQEIKPLLSPMQRDILIEKMKLNIEQIQWAIIHNDQSVYEFSIQKLLTTIETYFNEKATASQAILAQVKQLAGQIITVQKPDISSSQRLLKQFIDQEPVAANKEKAA